MLYKDLKPELEAFNWYINRILVDINKQDIPTFEQMETIYKTANKISERVKTYIDECQALKGGNHDK